MLPRRPAAVAVAVAALLGAASCARDDGATAAPSATADPSPSTSTTTTTTTTTTTSTPTTTTSTSSSGTTSASPTTTTSTPASTTATTTPASTTSTVAGAAEVVEIGRSVEGRPIVAERFGTPGGRRVLVIGVIHGNEDDGVMIVDELRTRGAPDGVELWLVASMNPDGQAAQIRHNARGVDLNRNFPHDWGPIGEPGDGQYAGTGPASEPETQAMVAFIETLRPDITIWYHQDLYVISPGSGRNGRIRERYADLTGLPIGEITGGRYTGIAATWANRALETDDAVAFIVELGGTTSPAEVVTHAEAVLTIAREG